MTNTHHFIANSLADLVPIANSLSSDFKENRVFIFRGSMGAGKTTLIKAFCTALGVDPDEVNSPSFAIANEYLTKTNKKIYHFDFYRIRSEEEAYDMGYEEFFYSDDICLIEWPEMVESLIPEDAITVHIKVDEQETRYIDII